MDAKRREAVVTKLAKMEFNTGLLRSWGPKFDEIKSYDSFTDEYGRTFHIYGEKDAWEKLYADPLLAYRGHLFELLILYPDLEERGEIKSLLSAFVEIQTKKKRGVFGGEKEDYDGKAKLLPKFVETHNLVKAYVKTHLEPLVTDDELQATLTEIEKVVTVAEEEAEFEEEELAPTQSQTEPEPPSEQTAAVSPEEVETNPPESPAPTIPIEEQSSVQPSSLITQTEKPRYIFSAHRDIKSLEEIFDDYDVSIARLNERSYEEIYNVQSRLCKALEASGIKILEGGDEILLSNLARLKDLELLDKGGKISEEQKLLLRNNWEQTKKRFREIRDELFDLLVAKYQGA